MHPAAPLEAGGPVTAASPGGDGVGSSLAVLVRGMLAVGVALVLAAGVVGLVRDGRLPTAAVDLGALPLELLRLKASAWGTLGVLVFLATPPAAVGYLGVVFHRAGDRAFTVIAGAVFVFILSGLVVAWVAQGGAEEVYLPAAPLLPEAGILVAGVLAGALGVTLGLGEASSWCPSSRSSSACP